jgi:hypothetical protein
MSEGMKQEITFPVYRQYPGGKSVFKLLNERSFIERQKMGDKYFEHSVEAKVYPDFLLIQDMIDLVEDRFESAGESDFLRFETDMQRIN